MDKRVLLVLFSLQVFLLITAFNSTDAAALVRDDQRPPSPILEVSEPNRGKDGKRVKRFPGWRCRLGGCSLFGRAPPTNPPRRHFEELLKKNKLQPVLQN
ncbi:hypothetical protein VZT92_003849 [Zoarces viviparus]|uniref:Uncharacterized protein n=1 Tax=Zoarces viviparus TaxID=48416 RepID=A0AAW1FVW7_ZOAVI